MSDIGKAFLLGVVIFAVWFLAVLRAHALPEVVGGVYPPKRYDYPFPGVVIIQRARLPDGWYGYTVPELLIPRKRCVIQIAPFVRGRDLELVLRHEMGHCNGWLHGVR